MSYTLRSVLCLSISLLSWQALSAQSDFDDPQWRFVLRQPADGWQTKDFDDSKWREGFGGFGEPSTPGSRIGTVWRTDDIWLRRTIDLDVVPERPALLIHHDEDAEVSINGRQVATFSGYVTEYKLVPLDAEGKAALNLGKNVLAVHCHQTGGGQFIDVHIVDADNVPTLPEPQRSTTPFQSELITQWGEEVAPENAWTEYPRPMLKREQWTNLNGHWDYAITPREQTTAPTEWAGKILVPFCLESRLSGVQRLLDPSETLWYRRTFSATPMPDRRTLLNFEAVDYHCEVWVNDEKVGEHTGGNVPFTFDVTEALRDGDNTLLVRVEDDTEGSPLRGKQVLDPRGIWYTRVSGIWQTVWLETVPRLFVADLKITTNAEERTIAIRPIVNGKRFDSQLRIRIFDGNTIVWDTTSDADEGLFAVPDAKLWSPESPHLYDLEISLVTAGGEVIDQVRSYAGIRSVGKTLDADGHLRFTLNGEPIFHWGPLDQGWWPDGLLTPPSDEAMLFEIEWLKSAGFNMIRKHIKVEPRRYYYHCDRLGMMLWQDQVSGGRQPEWTRLRPNPNDAQWSDEDHLQFMAEFEAMVDSLENHPSIVVWVPFNEAWGQHRTVEVGKWIEERDPTRLVNIASGGNFWPVGDVVDHHSYPHPDFPFAPERFGDYIKVIGEFGGHGYPVPGHLWDADRRNWGYGGLPKDKAEYKARYVESLRLLNDFRKQGIAGGVYTQTTDVEGEINGLMTYDRKEIKIPAEELKGLHRRLFDDLHQ